MARRNRNSSRRESAPGWVWMLFGLGLGLIVAIGVYLRAPTGARTAEPTRSGRRRRRRTAGRAHNARGAARRRRTDSSRESLRVLRDPAAVRGRRVPTTTRRASAAARPRPAEAPGSYLLQAGSFSAAADADRLQGQSRAARVRIARAARHDRRRRVQPRAHRPDRRPRRRQTHAAAASRRRHRHAADAGPEVTVALRPASVVGQRLAKIDAQRAQLAIEVRALHADALRELADLAAAEQ